jgi:TolB-like protein
VLPFANLSGDPGQDYLVDALTDELTTSLARIRGSFVIARNTAMTFKGKPVDAKAIGKDLGVRYVLEGSVQPSGDRMRVAFSASLTCVPPKPRKPPSGAASATAFATAASQVL